MLGTDYLLWKLELCWLFGGFFRSQDDDEVPLYFWVIPFGWPSGNQGNAALSAGLFYESCATLFWGLFCSAGYFGC
ncbi:hypothetical protein MA16_Dca003336 [Dendrobium catenatum]|uniref:Uncharacterized protein n=1 Tax=Dendrobium catenatum TaxID=906689 RepID=A0A2I0XCG3_9ASPA|nr:hypothetical protein MA16_Dca003336 [Dendrobium catenatum]